MNTKIFIFSKFVIISHSIPLRAGKSPIRKLPRKVLVGRIFKDDPFPLVRIGFVLLKANAILVSFGE